jgi:hypothetical protein
MKRHIVNLIIVLLATSVPLFLLFVMFNGWNTLAWNQGWKQTYVFLQICGWVMVIVLFIHIIVDEENQKNK